MSGIRKRIWRLLILALCFPGAHVALADPPASCACKFVGEWVYSGGTTTVHPNGTATPHCLFCVPNQNWTCQGNTYLFSNSGAPGQFTATLSAPDTMVGSFGAAKRVTPSACAPAPTKAREPRQDRNAPCTGDASGALEVTNRLNNGYYDFKIKNGAQCPVCFNYNDCDKSPAGSAACKVKPMRLGKTGSASGDIVGSNYSEKLQPMGARFCK